jgi:hypothetical protein
MEIARQAGRLFCVVKACACHGLARPCQGAVRPAWRKQNE